MSIRAKRRASMKDMYKRIAHDILSTSEREVVVLTFLYLLITIFSPSHKFVFVISSIYFLLMVYLTGSIIKTIFYSFFPLWLFRVGREFVFTAVPPESIESAFYWGEGRNLTFELTAFFILGITSVFVLVALYIKKRGRILMPNFLLFFLVTFLLHFISSALSTSGGVLSFLYTISEFSYLVWLLFAIYLIRSVKSSGKVEILTTLFLILFGILVLEAGVTLLQVANRSVLGLSVEKVLTTPSFGAGAEESALLYRPIGLNYHANGLANWVIALFYAMLLLWFRVKGVFPKYVSSLLITTTVGLSVLVILLTLSRSAYLGLFISFVAFYLFDRNSLLKAKSFLLRYLKNFKIPILVILIFLSFIIVNRVLSSIYSFDETGGFSTRREQVVEAMELVRTKPALGVGIGMFIPSIFDFNPQGSVRYFPENIHNGFVLYLAERGLLAMFLYIIGIYLFLRIVVSIRLSKTVKLLIISGIISNYVMMLFQPFVNTLSINILVAGLILVSHNR